MQDLVYCNGIWTHHVALSRSLSDVRGFLSPYSKMLSKRALQIHHSFQPLHSA
jgi:hypothetical protein